MQHWHARTSESGFLVESVCFHGETGQLEKARDFLSREIVVTQESWRLYLPEVVTDLVSKEYGQLLNGCLQGAVSDSWIGEITVDGVRYGFDLMAIDGACDAMI
ncbi:hypothetical protein ABZ470_23775 [Streptosporangium sp. NPDC020072]|uniref:hypothetical protein n=1 Tax=Streptosporangium sp. NPDC020072 TaxID=3154788 RepID=UPI00343FCC57